MLLFSAGFVFLIENIIKLSFYLSQLSNQWQQGIQINIFIFISIHDAIVGDFPSNAIRSLHVNVPVCEQQEQIFRCVVHF